MRNEPNTGGSAFPRTISTAGDGCRTEHLSGSLTYIDSVGGMTLRDYFAAKCLPQLLATTMPIDLNALGELVPNGETTYSYKTKLITATAYAIADAMIAVREECK